MHQISGRRLNGNWALIWLINFSFYDKPHENVNHPPEKLAGFAVSFAKVAVEVVLSEMDDQGVVVEVPLVAELTERVALVRLVVGVPGFLVPDHLEGTVELPFVAEQLITSYFMLIWRAIFCINYAQKK